MSARAHRTFNVACLLALSAAIIVPATAMADPADEIFYQFMPIAWRDSDNDPQRFGDFGGMTASLDYLQSLGVTAVWMNPIFPTAAYHGYQHGPADQVNSRFGTEAAFWTFVQQAHQRGIKVFLDYVAYGISQNTTWYANAYNNPASPYDSWLAFTNAANTTYTGSVYTTWNGASVGFIHWNLDNPNPVNLNITWARHWLDPNGDGDPGDGIDGFRLDHAYTTAPEGWGANLSFWQTWNGALRSLNPAVFTFAEQGDWGNRGTDLLAAFDSCFTKPWEFAVRNALTTETASSLYSETVATVNAQPAGRHFLGTIGDHDVDRIGSVVGGSVPKEKAAAAILMTAPFPPIVYFGDEIGMLGTKGNWGTDANDIPMREPFKWNRVAGPPMSNYSILNSQAYNNRFARDNDGRSVEEQSGVTGSLLEEYKRLITLRKTHVALRRGQYVPVTSSTSRVWSFLRHQPNQETLLVAIRLRNTAGSGTLDLSTTTIPGGSTTVVDLLSGQALPNITNANKAAYSLTLPAYGYVVLSVNLAPNAPPPADVDGVDIPAALGAFSLAATQNNATGLGDNICELNQLFVRARPNALRIGATGNLATDGTGLALLFDTTAGGQNVLNFSGTAAPPAGPGQMTGLRLDAGFAPDYMLWINTAGGAIYVDQFTLPTSAPATKVYRGQNSVGSGNGTLSGGSNPNGMQVAMNNTNTAGVTATDASGAATARNGFDLLIPFSDVGISGLGGAVRIAAVIVRNTGEVSNQWLPGVGGGLGNLGLAPDMTLIPADQFAMVPVVIPGDINADAVVDAADVGAFVNVILGLDTTPSRVTASDLNRDGSADGSDVQLFAAVLAGN